MIDRPAAMRALKTALRRNPVVALIGPRQCGKTTLARQLLAPGGPNYFDLEDPASAARLEEPMTALGELRGLVVIDEVQRRPELFPMLRVLADRPRRPAKFLVLGSAAPDLLRQSAESLAGRMETVTLGGLSASEVGQEAIRRHWLRGGFPRSFLARSETDSMAWRKQFVQTVVERDLPFLTGVSSRPALMRFWTMLAHYHGQIWNAADPAKSLGVNESTTRRYLDLLTSVFMVRQLQPWHENLGKRQVKSPKIYLSDTGILHCLLGIGTESDLVVHPKCGASWEGYAMEEVLHAADADDVFFWATHAGAELDLMLLRRGRRIGVEFKRADAPRLTPSMRSALEDLKLDSLAVVYPGEQTYRLADRVTVVPLNQVVASGRKALGAA